MKLVDLHPVEPSDDPDKVLEDAKGIYRTVVLIGWNMEDRLEFRSSSNQLNKDILWLITLLQHKIMNGDYLE